MAKWFTRGDKHTGWHTPDGTPLTDNQAKKISDDLTKRQQADRDRYNAKGRTK